MRLISRLIRAIFPSIRSQEEKINAAIEAKLKSNHANADPLDIFARSKSGGWKADAVNPIQLTIADFPVTEFGKPVVAMDGKSTAMDDGEMATAKGRVVTNGVPEQLQGWYSSQSFIGYQACAIISQNWLVDKACSLIGEDAVRNGWEIKAMGDEEALSKDDLDLIRSYDEKFSLKRNLAEFDRFKNIFGIRVAIFHVESDDEKYYEKPFNIDGITENSYKGISQIDPYWMMPTMTANSTSDPSSIHFYEPEFWTINGRKYHRSHLIIATGPQPADVLKPTYMFGGVSLVQRIYERVYAAERTANEAPLLSMSKRTTALHVDVDKMMLNEKKFTERLAMWIKYRDNHAVKVLGKEETMEQFDTNLSDFDSIIMNQYQIVAAISKTPSTKLLGTSPKGFNATGEFEMIAYHQELESVQEHVQHPLLQRHCEILVRSLGFKCEVKAVFNPVDSVTAAQQAELNEKKANTRKSYVDMGSVSPDEVRDVLRDEKDSGFNRLTDEAAETEPGMSPEALADMEKAGQEAAPMPGAAPAPVPPGAPEADDAPPTKPGLNTPTTKPVATVAPSEPQPSSAIMSAMGELLARVKQLEALTTPEGKGLPNGSDYVKERTTSPGIAGMKPTVAGAGSLVPIGANIKHPKMKVNGMLLEIENPRGTLRRGVTLDGEEWETNLKFHYGFIRGVMGADGDELDCFVGDNLAAPNIYVINQNDPLTGEFDEHKVMIGFDSPQDAQEAYQSSYQAGWTGFAGIVPLTMEQFKAQLATIDWTKPLRDSVSMDKGEFKEDDHPRAKNGQFGSGGGGSGGASASSPKKSEVMKKSPLGSKKDALPNLAKKMTEENKGTPPTPEQFHEMVTSMGVEIIPAQSVKYLKMYLKTLKEEKEGKPAEPKKPDTPKAPEKAEPTKPSGKTSEEFAKSKGFSTPIGLATESANANGYATEGKYNGIDYFKAPNGDKVSYKADSDSWVAVSGGKITAQGQGVEGLQAYIEGNKAKPAEPSKTATPAVAPVENHSTAGAKAYGTQIPEEKFQFSSKGIANETALPAKIQSSILAYKGSDYIAINDAIRYSDAFDPSTVSPQTMAHILNLQRAFSVIAPSKEDATVGRKVGLEALKSMAKQAGLASLKDLKPGMVLKENGVVSTSHSEKVWTGDVRFEIKVPKGSKAIDISETIKKYQGEQEVLLPPDSKFKISTVNENHTVGGKKYKYSITCELIK